MVQSPTSMDILCGEKPIYSMVYMASLANKWKLRFTFSWTFPWFLSILCGLQIGLATQENCMFTWLLFWLPVLWAYQVFSCPWGVLCTQGPGRFPPLWWFFICFCQNLKGFIIMLNFLAYEYHIWGHISLDLILHKCRVLISHRNPNTFQGSRSTQSFLVASLGWWRSHL